MDLLNNLRVFIRVVDCASFTAAADALDLSTAQVSRLVADLEEHVQARLLQRTTRRLSLTEAGERFLLRSRQIVEEMDEATAEARGAHINPAGRLRVHSMNGLGVLITPLIARYSELYPDVVFELTLSQRNPDPLEEGHDVVISIAPELADSQMVAQAIGQIYSVPCASADYLQRRGVPDKPLALNDHQCLRMLDPLYSDQWLFQDEARRTCRQSGQDLSVQCRRVDGQGLGGRHGHQPAAVPHRDAALERWHLVARVADLATASSAMSMRCIRRGAFSMPRSAPGWTFSRPSFPACSPNMKR